MDQVKTGRFIAERRKLVHLTQMQLAEKLNITDRAVSKWETGRSMPDSAIMPELCGILQISINDLFNGEVIVMDNYKERTEKLLLEMAKQKEEADKKLLTLEILIGVFASVILLGTVFAASYIEMPVWLKICLIIAGFIPFIIGMAFALKIEQTAGYYECAECGHRYVPTFKSVLFAPHINRTRYMRCPECNKKSWNKKVLGKEK
ncbi:MAG: helix-turn-helix transcriptional regulator [Ruminococcus sp.]|nr:helix-turn-helix transcriptional regulator [Ruminococcus sp.]